MELKAISGADRVVSNLSQFFSDTTLSVSSLASYNCTQILDLLPAAIYLTDASGTLLYFNATAAELWGREPIRGSERWCGAWKLYTKDGSPLAVDQCPMAIAVKTKRPVRGIEAVIERPDGIRVPVIPFPTPIFDASGEMIGAINMIVDISDRKRAESRISYLADHDALTGLRNRASMRSWVDGLVAGDDGRRQQFALLALDLRRFRNVKDVYGHTVAETLLRDFSRLLRSAARGAAMARFGFDEFLVLVEARDAEAEAAQFHNRLMALLADDGTAGQGPFRMEVAIGGAVYPRDGLDFDTLFSRAGAALFRTKKAGTTTIQYFDSQTDTQIQETRAILRDLDSALRSKKLELHYQPKFDMQGEVRGFEALARWPHPTRGMIPPDTFIRLAEENGLILQLGEWAMEEACKEAAKWDEHLTVAVNVSPVQFRFGDLPATVQSILERTGLAPERLELEITEGVLIHDIKRATVILLRLRLLGVRIALDDFGVGYSSLSYLHSLPFNKIKLDRSLMREATATSRSGVVVASVIDLCHKLGMTVLAEGIEEDCQLDFLRDAHCDEVQGFLLGRPKPIAAYARTVGEKSSSAAHPNVA